MTRSNPDFLNGVPELLILRLLSLRSMHGYELVQAIHAASGQALSFGEGCIYPVLHRLEAGGLLAGNRERVGGRRRVVYQLTKDGAARLSKSVAEWIDIVAAVHRVLGGQDEQSPLDRTRGTQAGASGAAPGLRPPRRGRAA